MAISRPSAAAREKDEQALALSSYKDRLHRFDNSGELIRHGELLLDLRGDLRSIGRGLGFGDAVFQPADGEETIGRTPLRRPHLHNRPQLTRRVEAEAGRHDAGYGVARIVESQPAADGGRIGSEQLPPEMIAHDHGARSSRFSFLREECAPEHGLRA
jgi:hypothetical protein